MNRDSKGRFIKGHKGHTYWKDKQFSPEHKDKLSNSHKEKVGYWKGKKRPNFKSKSLFKLGDNPWNKGISRSEETKNKIRKNKIGKCIGKNNPNWKEGASFLPYGPEFNKTLKTKIRKRDNFTCQLCKDKIEKQTKTKFLTVHHIDYDKKNNLENNLIALCNFCNSSVNKDRTEWIKHFKNMKGET